MYSQEEFEKIVGGDMYSQEEFDNAIDEAYNKGYEDARLEYESYAEEAYDKGYEAASREYNDEDDEAYDRGYNEGYEDCKRNTPSITDEHLLKLFRAGILGK